MNHIVHTPITALAAYGKRQSGERDHGDDAFSWFADGFNGNDGSVGGVAGIIGADGIFHAIRNGRKSRDGAGPDSGFASYLQSI